MGYVCGVWVYGVCSCVGVCVVCVVCVYVVCVCGVCVVRAAILCVKCVYVVFVCVWFYVYMQYVCGV